MMDYQNHTSAGVVAVGVAAGAYLALGLVFAIASALGGVKKIDPHATRGSWGFRLLIIPGAMAFWPLLLRRWASGVKSPPEECNSHRIAAKVQP